GLDDVVFRGVAFLALHVGKSHARAIRGPAADADIADRDPVIGSDNPSCGGRRLLTVNRRLERIRRGNRSGSGRRLFYEIPACVRAGQRRVVVLIHKKLSVALVKVQWLTM